MRGAKIGQIQMIFFLAMLFVPKLFPVWLMSLFFEDKEL